MTPGTGRLPPTSASRLVPACTWYRPVELFLAFLVVVSFSSLLGELLVPVLLPCRQQQYPSPQSLQVAVSCCNQCCHLRMSSPSSSSPGWQHYRHSVVHPILQSCHCFCCLRHFHCCCPWCCYQHQRNH